MPRDEVRTLFASQATALSVRFNDMFGDLKLPPGYTVDLTAPDGPSTGGGVQTLQHIRLHAPDAGPTLVIGSLDTGQMKASLRTFAHLHHLALQRSFGLTLDEPSYNAFSARARKFCEGHKFVFTLEHTPEPVTEEVRPVVVKASQTMQKGSRFWLGFFVAAPVFASLGAGAMWYLLRR